MSAYGSGTGPEYLDESEEMWDELDPEEIDAESDEEEEK
jgi:hypothetical protein